MQLDANGNPVNGICSRCGQALKYVYFYEGKPVGSTCWLRLSGVPIEIMGRMGYIDDGRNIDLDRYRRDQEADEAAREQAARHRAQLVTEIKASNQWLIDELLYHVNQSGFCASISEELANGIKAEELPPRAKSIISDIVARDYGRRNSKAYNSKINELDRKLNPDEEWGEQ